MLFPVPVVHRYMELFAYRFTLITERYACPTYYHDPSVANSPSVANHGLASQQLNDSLRKYSGTCKPVLGVRIYISFQKNWTR